MNKNIKFLIIDNSKTILIALIIALVIRSLFFQPFYIPSASMEPTLLVGDRLFVSKFSYGYSRHSFPFSPTNINKRYFFNEPVRGDVIVFKTPADNRTDYIKRLIGLPGDTIQFINGSIYSFEVGLRKPDPSIYRKALSISNTVATEALFIDDLIENIESAKKLGWNTIHYKSYNSLKEELNYQGIETSELN